MRRARAAATLIAATVVFALIASPVLGQQVTAALVEEALVQLILRRHSDLLLAPHVQLGSASVLSADLRNSLVFVEVDNPQLQGRYLPARVLKKFTKVCQPAKSCSCHAIIEFLTMLAFPP